MRQTQCGFQLAYQYAAGAACGSGITCQSSVICTLAHSTYQSQYSSTRTRRALWRQSQNEGAVEAFGDVALGDLRAAEQPAVDEDEYSAHRRQCRSPCPQHSSAQKRMHFLNLLQKLR